MPSDTIVRWSVSVPRTTDVAVRSFLASRGRKKGDLSKFIEDAVKWRLLDQSMSEARAGFADLPSDVVETLATEAVTTVRQTRQAHGRQS